jgi:hypothetical protein
VLFPMSGRLLRPRSPGTGLVNNVFGGGLSRRLRASSTGRRDRHHRHRWHRPRTPFSVRRPGCDPGCQNSRSACCQPGRAAEPRRGLDDRPAPRFDLSPDTVVTIGMDPAEPSTAPPTSRCPGARAGNPGCDLRLGVLAGLRRAGGGAPQPERRYVAVISGSPPRAPASKNECSRLPHDRGGQAGIQLLVRHQRRGLNAVAGGCAGRSAKLRGCGSRSTALAA